MMQIGIRKYVLNHIVQKVAEGARVCRKLCLLLKIIYLSMLQIFQETFAWLLRSTDLWFLLGRVYRLR